MENKKDILESLFETLTRTRKWSDEIAEMLYHKDKNGNEEVLVRLYEGNAEMFIDVTGDSGMALIKDVIAASKDCSIVSMKKYQNQEKGGSLREEKGLVVQMPESLKVSTATPLFTNSGKTRQADKKDLRFQITLLRWETV